jgi:hypothetical protein
MPSQPAPAPSPPPLLAPLTTTPTNAAATLFGHAAAMLTNRVDDGAWT